jgi:spore photoproduct lyase
VVPIDSYQSLLGRRGQRYSLQKKSPALVLAVARPPFAVSLSSQCQKLDVARSYAASLVLGCPFSCEYCYVQGVYGCGHTVVFVNIEQVFAEIAGLGQHSGDTVSVSASLETDLLAMEKDLGLCARWIEFLRDKQNIQVELRTKSAAYDLIHHIAPSPNVILAWSLAPSAVWERFEHGTASPRLRIENARRAAVEGWPVRLCFDPMIIGPEGLDEHLEFISKVFDDIPPSRVHSVFVGGFRMSANQLRLLRRDRPCSKILHASLGQDGDCEAAAAHIARYVGEDKVVLWKKP